MKAVRRVGDPRQAEDAPTVGGRVFEVPIEGEYAEGDRWETQFRESVHERLGKRSAIRNADRFVGTLVVDVDRITFVATANEAPALPDLLDAISYAIGRANEREKAQQGIDAQTAAKLQERREVNDEALEDALRKWSRENPPQSE